MTFDAAADRALRGSKLPRWAEVTVRVRLHAALAALRSWPRGPKAPELPEVARRVVAGAVADYALGRLERIL